MKQHRAVDSRAWTIAQQLRARRGWRLDDASFTRSWSVHVGAAAFDVSAHVLLAFSAPCMVIRLTPSKAGEAVRHLQASLGERYRRDPRGHDLVAVVRTDKPKPLLAELARVEEVLGLSTTTRIGPSPRSQDDRRWHVVEAFRASSWQIGSLSFTRKLGDKRRQVRASVAVVVDSASGRPGILANVAGWVPEASERWMQFCTDIAVRLAARGFGAAPPEACFFHLGRWVEGLSGARASKQADVFDQLLDTGGATALRTRSSAASARAAPHTRDR